MDPIIAVHPQTPARDHSHDLGVPCRVELEWQPAHPRPAARNRADCKRRLCGHYGSQLAPARRHTASGLGRSGILQNSTEHQGLWPAIDPGR